MEDALRCNLSGKIMFDAVVAADGFSYERAQLEAAAVEEAVKSPAAQDTTSTRGVGGPRISPVTGRALGFRGGVANNHVRNLAEAWRRTGGSGGVEWRQAMEEETKCPITMSRMLDPVVTCDGHSYERAAIIRWLQRHHTSPKSNLTLGSKALVTNRALAAIARLHEEEMEEVGRAELNT